MNKRDRVTGLRAADQRPDGSKRVVRRLRYRLSSFLVFWLAAAISLSLFRLGITSVSPVIGPAALVGGLALFGMTVGAPCGYLFGGSQGAVLGSIIGGLLLVLVALILVVTFVSRWVLFWD